MKVYSANFDWNHTTFPNFLSRLYSGQSTSSQWVGNLASQGTFGNGILYYRDFRETFSCHLRLVGRSRDNAKYAIMHRTAAYTNNYLAPNVSGEDVEKSCTTPL